MPRPIHFEIHASDRDRCKAFYEALFGWSFVQPPGMEGYHLISTGAADEPGINGGLVQRMGENPDPKDPVPVTAYVCTIGVEDVDRYVGKALSLGGSVALPKMAVPGVGWLAYVKDTESNILGLMQNDPAAA